MSKKVGKSRAYITNSLRILKLPASVRKQVNDGKISLGHAKALLAIDDENKIIEVANRIVKDDLTVRDVEKLSKKKETKKSVKKPVNPYIESVRNNLEDKFQTSVELDNKKIVIHYNGTDDLNRILELIDCLEKD